MARKKDAGIVAELGPLKASLAPIDADLEEISGLVAEANSLSALF
jgi:hypothetical protein